MKLTAEEGREAPNGLIDSRLRSQNFCLAA